MKIKTEYDIPAKINHSVNGIKPSELFFMACKMFPFVSYINILNIITTCYLLNKGILLSLSISGFCGVFEYIFLSLISNKNKNTIMESADIDLQHLIYELSRLEIKTTTELLKNCKLNEVNYKVEYIDDSMLPKLKQYKYINIPLDNGYEQTLLQEHIIGDNEYEISVDGPTKKKIFKPEKINQKKILEVIT